MEIKLSNQNKKIKGKGLIAFYFQEGGVSISISEKGKKDFEVINSFFIELEEKSVNQQGYINSDKEDDVLQRIESTLKINKINPKKYDFALIINNYSKKQKVINANLNDKNIIYFISNPSNSVFGQTNPTLETHYFDYYKVADNEIIAYTTPKEDLDEFISKIEKLGSSVKLITPLDEAIIDTIKNESSEVIVLNVGYNKKGYIYIISDDKLIVNKQEIDLDSNLMSDDGFRLLDEVNEEDELSETLKKIKSSLTNTLGLHAVKNVFITGNITTEDINKINDSINSAKILPIIKEEKQDTALTNTVSLRRVNNGKY